MPSRASGRWRRKPISESDNFFTSWIDFPGDGDPLRAVTNQAFDTARVERLRRGPASDHDDLDVIAGLAQPVHDEFQHGGTDGQQELGEDDIRIALLALSAPRTGLASLGSTPAVPRLRHLRQLLAEAGLLELLAVSARSAHHR